MNKLMHGASHSAMLCAPRADASPSLETINSAVADMSKAFAAFKEKNDERLSEIEKKGTSDAVLNEHVDRINGDLGDLSARVDEFIKKQEDQSIAANRTGLAGPAREDLFNEAHGFYNMASGRVVDAAQVDIDAYAAYKSALSSYIRRGDTGINMETREALLGIRNAMSVGSDQDGGFLVPTERSSEMIKRLHDLSPVRQYARAQQISGDKLEIPVDADLLTIGGWGAETEAPSETATPKLRMQTIEAHTLWAEPRVSQQVLEDAQVDVEAWLSNKIAEIFAITESSAFVNGNGVGKPHGFMSKSSVTTADKNRAWGKIQYVPTGAAGAFAATGSGADCLVTLVHEMKPQYRTGALWAANRSTIAAVRKLKDADGNYLWQMGNIQAGQPQQLLGYGLAEFEDMDSIGANNLAMAFVNFQLAYLIVDRIGITILRDPYTGKPQVKFYSRKRTGGDVVNFDALKYLKFSST